MASEADNGFDLTPVQRRMWDILRDGEAHAIEELHGCLVDDLSPHSNVWAHLTAIRKQIKVRDLFIICDNRRYQIVKRSGPVAGHPGGRVRR